jgi:site-specific recombinase XerD
VPCPFQSLLGRSFNPPQGVHPVSASADSILAAVKSLLGFAQQCGAIRFNVGAALKLRRGQQTITARLLSEEQVFALFAAAGSARDEALLRLLYATGARSVRCRG